MLATPERAVSLFPVLDHQHDRGRVRGGNLLPVLAARYGGSLAIPLRDDRPTVVANFVSTLDGVVSYATPEAAGGGEISGFFEADRFVMGLLRSLADAVLIGAGTLRAAPDERWTPAAVHPASADDFATLRERLGLRRQPITAIVTASGDIDLDHPGLSDPAVEVVIVTTQAGADSLRDRGVSAHLDVRSTGDVVRPSDVIETLRFHGADLILCEGGPHLFGQLMRAELVDELFLTLAPQLAGRSGDQPRLSLVEDTAFDVAGAPWARLIGLRQAGDHLFTRYRLSGGPV